MGGASTGTVKMLEKLEKSIVAGHYYEAQQMYKSVHARYMAQKKAADALELVQSGACLQLQHGQVNCGVELGVLLVETLTSVGVKYSPEALGRIKSVYESFPKAGQGSSSSSSIPENGSNDADLAAARVDGCMTFLKAAIRWSVAAGGPSTGAPELHDMLAEYIWSQSPEKDLATASKYFIYASKPEAYAAALIDSMNECYRGEIDLIIIRGALQYLAVGNLQFANRLFDEIQQRSRAFSAPPIPDSPLMHFLKFLLLALERDALPLFRLLRVKYQRSLYRDPALEELLDEIAFRFYGVKRASEMPGFLGDFMKMLTGNN
eukprot:TRINITY_DN9222_c0_g1_i1.p1 TRINITY_DN9222_c0_g1~~TRINITY_DN9222_c0_g1_i1.p1  ORF type:complete len:320 (-),score=60.31 TRINITY_DN9222_c0_g1_i1:443-1402(-)